MYSHVSRCFSLFVFLALGLSLTGGSALAVDDPRGGVSGHAPPEVAMVGVNLASGEFGGLPGVYDRDYAYPGPRQFDYCKAKGLTVVRLPFRWERLQPSLMGPLDAQELKRLDDVIGLARDRHLKILLDAHNYARYRDKIIGTPDVPNAAFADFWKGMATHYRDETAVFAYGLMNEPHDTGSRWPAAAQAAIEAIRTVDKKHTVSVCGDGWSGAHSWKQINGQLILKDPAANLIYEAHQYFDRDNSGTYGQSYDGSGANPNLGVERLRPFVEWLKEHNARGFIGEFGVPGDDPRWLVVLDNFLSSMKRSRIGGTYWAAGPWWGDYRLSSEPKDGKDRPQMEVLELYAGARQKPKDAKPSYFDAALRLTKRPPSAVAGKKLPLRTTKLVYDFGTQNEPYFYSNEGSEIKSEAVDDVRGKARRISYRHRGSIAWAGAGVYFGGLDCNGYSAFSLMVRAKKATKLEIKAYHSDSVRCAGAFAVGAEWQKLIIPFDALKDGDGHFDPARGLWKIEFQPDTDQAGSSIDFGQLKLVAR